MKVFTTENIELIEKKFNTGKKINRHENVWYQAIPYTRKCGINFLMTSNEMKEWSKCFNSLEYFMENQSKIKLENGDVGKMSLRGYQKEAIKLMNDKRFTLFFRSRQVGLTVVIALYFLHILLFNDNKKIVIVPFVVMNGKEFIRKMKDIYYRLPFFLKQGIVRWTDIGIEFENGSKIDIKSPSKEFIHDEDTDITLLNDLSRITNQEEVYKEIITKIKKDGRLIIDSGPKGVNFFYDLVKDAERFDGDPDKNIFNLMRIYWWQVPGRDEKWRLNQIKIIGEEMWNQEYGLFFVDYEWKFKKIMTKI